MLIVGDDICELIEGRYGGSLPLDILADLAEDRGLQLDMEAYEVKKGEMRVSATFLLGKEGIYRLGGNRVSARILKGPVQNSNFLPVQI